MIDLFAIAVLLAQTAQEAPTPALSSAEGVQVRGAEQEPSARRGRSDRTAGAAGQIGAAAPPWSISSGAAPGRGQPPASNAPPAAGGGLGAPEILENYFMVVKLNKATTGTGFFEEFAAYAPDQSQPRPLLVVFHRWGVGYLDALFHTPFFELARERKWHILAPLSASGVHVNSFQGQANTELAMEWMLANFNVNRDRIYGAGFSMGGGMALNFAARHLDPNEYMFAAVVNHTGSVAQYISYNNENPGPWPPGPQGIWDFWYGPGGVAPPDPFQMLRTSVIDFDLQTLAVDPKTDMVSNLKHVPLRVSRADNEAPATSHLTTQCDVLVNHMIGLGAMPAYDIVPFTGHSWDSLDFTQAMAFLDQWKLRMPTNGDTLADEDGTYFYFYIHQDVPGAFTPFSWSVSEVQNKILVWNTKNLKQVDVDLLGSGLSPNQILRVVLETKDGLPDDTLVKGWLTDPTEVLRDGVSQLGMGTYSYDAQKQELFIQEWDGGLHIWDVTP